MASSLRDITISGNDIDSLVAFAKTRATKKTRWSISYKEPNEYQRTLGEVAKELHSINPDLDIGKAMKAAHVITKERLATRGR